MRLLNKNEFRDQHHERFIADTKEISFIPIKAPFPMLTLTELCAFTKLISSLPEGSSQFFALNQKLRMLRVLIFGKDDPYHEVPKTNEQIYAITRGRFRFSGYP
jgi:hypothetical protein